MTNNDELAIKLRKVISHGAPGVWLSQIEVESLLAEREADKKRIAELEARTVSVPTFEEWCQMEGMKPIGWVREAMKEAYDGCRAAAGTKLEVGE